MIQAFHVADVRRCEDALRARLMADGEDELVLMKRAARGIAGVVRARAKELGTVRVVALVGPGDNGGDALFACARLARRGLTVTAVLAVEEPHAGGLRAAERAGVPLVRAVAPGAGDAPGPEDAARRAGSDGAAETADVAGAPAEALAAVAEADLVLDGLLGIGGRPGLSGIFAELVAAIDEDAYVVAIDLPSGADPAGLVADPDGVFADETLAMGCLKPVHLLPTTSPAVGLVTVVDIGLEVEAVPAVERLTFDDAADLWPVPGPGDDKYSRGVLGVVAGSEQYPGAAVLVSNAAAEAGVGMVRYVGPRRAGDLVMQRVPEAVLGAGRVQAWALGSGLSGADALNVPQREATREASASDLPLLLDAGALTMLQVREAAADEAPCVIVPREAPTLLTPHAGELATLLTRLTGEEVTREDVQATPVQWATEAANRTGATVLLKGATTLVVSPEHELAPIRCQQDAPAWLATAGSGDTLAGIAGMLLAAGLRPADAGALAALVHGVAADRANPGGPVRALAVGAAVPGVVAGLLRR